MCVQVTKWWTENEKVGMASKWFQSSLVDCCCFTVLGASASFRSLQSAVFSLAETLAAKRGRQASLKMNGTTLDFFSFLFFLAFVLISAFDITMAIWLLTFVSVVTKRPTKGPERWRRPSQTLAMFLLTPWLQSSPDLFYLSHINRGDVFKIYT